MKISSKNFTTKELACSCCNKNDTDFYALMQLQKIRDEFGPMALTSAYRCEQHPAERRKSEPGTHYQGIAFDVLCKSSSDKFRLVELALKHKANGIGIHKDFIHIDFRKTSVMWLY